MAKVNQLIKKIKMETKMEIVRFQILTHCYLLNITVSQADLTCLAYLAIVGEQELTTFCTMAFVDRIFSSTQSVRNCLTKAEKKGLVVKNGKNKKRIMIHPKILVVVAGTILLEYKILCLDSQES